MLSMCGGFWELGEDRDSGLGNGCIFNGRESKDSGVRQRVSGCIIDRTTDTETLKACVAHAHKKDLYAHPHTCQPANTCVHVLTCTGYRGLVTGQRFSTGMNRGRRSHKQSILVLPQARRPPVRPLVRTQRLAAELR